jgi:hypothetical protein
MDKVQDLPPSEVLAWYQKAIDELLLMQVRGTKNATILHAFQQRFDVVCICGVRPLPGVRFRQRPATPITANFKDEVEKRLLLISPRVWNSLPPCLNHRDYHSWNLMIHDEAVAVIDFQMPCWRRRSIWT